MLNALIRKTNTLMLEMQSSPTHALADEYSAALRESVEFVTENKVPKESVITIEDRIVRELMKKEDETKSAEEAAKARTELEEARREAEWISRSASSGMGAAQSRFVEAQMKLNDVRTRMERAYGTEKLQIMEELETAIGEYSKAKVEYDEVGNSDFDALLASRDAANARLKECEDKYNALIAEQARQSNYGSFSVVGSGMGAVARALYGEPVKFDGYEVYPANAENEEIYEGVPVSGITGDKDIDGRIVKVLGSVLADNAKFNRLMSEVRYRIYREISAVRAEIERIRLDIVKAARSVAADIKRIKSDAASAHMDAEKARAAAEEAERNARRVADALTLVTGMAQNIRNNGRY